jgi:hypothetical protein
MKITLDNLEIEGNQPARDLYHTLFTARLNSLGRLDEDGRLIGAPQAVKLEWAEKEINRLEQDALQDAEKRALKRILANDEQYLEDVAQTTQKASLARQKLQYAITDESLLDVLAESAAITLPGSRLP